MGPRQLRRFGPAVCLILILLPKPMAFQTPVSGGGGRQCLGSRERRTSAGRDSTALSPGGSSLAPAPPAARSGPPLALEMLRGARKQGVYLFMDRTIFSRPGINDLDDFMRAAPENAAVTYLRAVADNGASASSKTHKAGVGDRGVRYKTNTGFLDQACMERVLPLLEGAPSSGRRGPFPFLPLLDRQQ
ncbi:hypothetical protein T484DRAFT_1796728 [Baffinella frigidus]|nr:hypothetical protein T484DRAFT_1796728 [Cryptophyta sp. CCMP2293]